MSLRETFRTLAAPFAAAASIETAWGAIERGYNAEVRHYHNLAHLEHLLAELQPFESLMQDKTSVYFALFYHDLIYNVPGNTNEEESAAVAQQQLLEWNVPQHITAKVGSIILATKKHEATGDADTDLFTDADLAILAAPRERYARYAEEVRKEYKIYPDALYHPGRAQVLRHFLEHKRIFKTEVYFERYEAAARANLLWELSELKA